MVVVEWPQREDGSLWGEDILCQKFFYMEYKRKKYIIMAELVRETFIICNKCYIYAID